MGCGRLRDCAKCATLSGRASGHIFPLRVLRFGASRLVFRCLLRVKIAHRSKSMKYLLSVVENPCLLFKVRALRQESPIAVRLQFGAWSAQNGAPTRMKIAANCGCWRLIALNSPLYAREAFLTSFPETIHPITVSFW
jgi:hypothetical protein